MSRLSQGRIAPSTGGSTSPGRHAKGTGGANNNNAAPSNPLPFFGLEVPPAKGSAHTSPTVKKKWTLFRGDKSSTEEGEGEEEASQVNALMDKLQQVQERDHFTIVALQSRHKAMREQLQEEAQRADTSAARDALLRVLADDEERGVIEREKREGKTVTIVEHKFREKVEPTMAERLQVECDQLKAALEKEKLALEARTNELNALQDRLQVEKENAAKLQKEASETLHSEKERSAKLEKDLAASVAREAEGSQQRAQLNDKVKELEGRLALTEEALSKPGAKARLDELSHKQEREKRIAELERELEELWEIKFNLKQAKERAETAERDLEHAETENGKFREKIKELGDQLDSLTARKEALTFSMTGKINKLEEQVKKLEEHAKGLEHQAKSLTEAKEHAEKSLADANERCAKLEQQQQQQQQQQHSPLPDQDALQSARKTWEESLEAEKGRRSKAENELSSVREQLSALQDKWMELEEWSEQAKLKMQEAGIVSGESSTSSSPRGLAASSGSGGNLDQMADGSLAAAAAANTVSAIETLYREKNTALQKEIKSIKRSTKEAKIQYEAQLKKASKKLDEYKAKAQKADEELNTLRLRVVDTQAEVDNLRRELEARGPSGSGAGKLDSFDTEGLFQNLYRETLAALNEEQESRRAASVSHRTEVQNLRETVEELREECTELRADIEMRKLRATELERAYQNELKIEKEKEKSLELEAVRLKGTVSESALKSRVEELENELQRTRAATAGELLEAERQRHEADKQLLIEKQIAAMEELHALQQRASEWEWGREKLFLALVVVRKLELSMKGETWNDNATALWSAAKEKGVPATQFEAFIRNFEKEEKRM